MVELDPICQIYRLVVVRSKSREYSMELQVVALVAGQTGRYSKLVGFEPNYSVVEGPGTSGVENRAIVPRYRNRNCLCKPGAQWGIILTPNSH